MKKHLLAVGIIFLFLSSVFAPMTTGLDTDTSKVDVELDRMLDNLRYLCTSPYSFNNVKYEYYKEQLLKQYSSESSKDDLVFKQEQRELAIPVEAQLTPITSPMDSAWSMLCHDLHHTSQSPYITTDNPYIEKWRFYCEDWVMDTSVIDNNGTIYIPSPDWEVLAVNPDGTEKWRYKTNGLILGSSPAIAEDGTVYIGCWDSKLYALNPNGTKKWAVVIGGNVASSPAIAEDGTIYIGQSNNKIVAINSNGTIKWKYNTDYKVVSSPAIGDDGTIYCGSGDTYLYALYPNGSLKWRFKTGSDIKGPPSIADDGMVYTGSYDGYLYALYPNNGTMKWKCHIDGSSTNPSIGNDGTIYIGGDYLYAVYPNNGTMKWRFSVKGNIHQSSPAISADGIIYFGTDTGGYFYAVNPNGTERWHKKLSKGDYWIESSPSIAEDGTVYIGSSVDMSRGYLHAFGNIESNQPPDTPVIDGPTQVRFREMNWFTFRAIDPDRNPIQLYIDWGDGNSGWTGDEYASDEKMWQEYAWNKPGSYSIKAKVKDVMGEESDWGYFEVIVPRDKSTDNMLFRLIGQFPLLERLLDIWRFNS